MLNAEYRKPPHISAEMMNRNLREFVRWPVTEYVFATNYAALFAGSIHPAVQWDGTLMALCFSRGGIEVKPHGVDEYLLTTSTPICSTNMEGLPWRTGERRYGYYEPSDEHYRAPQSWCFVRARDLHKFLCKNEGNHNYIHAMAVTTGSTLKNEFLKRGLVNLQAKETVSVLRIEELLNAITDDMLEEAYKTQQSHLWAEGNCIAISDAMCEVLPSRFRDAATRSLQWITMQWPEASQQDGAMNSTPIHVKGGPNGCWTEKSAKGQYEIVSKIGKEMMGEFTCYNARRAKEEDWEGLFEAYTAKRIELWHFIVECIKASREG